VHALELSSFQLETVETLQPAVAAILNLTPDHLDRYGTLEAYAQAKARLLQLQGPDDHTLLNADDPQSQRFFAGARGRLHRFSTRGEVERGAFCREGRIVLRTAAGEEEVLETRALPQPGEHNVSNALAAALACRLVGRSPAEIAVGLSRYRPLAHRLERVAEIDGVLFYNDSKATNPDSTATALAAFEPGRIHLVLGGRDKGADWSDLIPQIARRVRCVLLVGEAAAALARRLGAQAPWIECETVARAVAQAFAGARSGDVVLLSPGCASFDQYANFEERGEDFRRVVQALRPRGRLDG
jgi:UDP-N-acetylmuramoylalanine--D-glutamate ligase